MKVLVYGAGVLGSYLAHELYEGKHDVTILARGSRLKNLQEKGLIINHVKQKKRTTDHVNVTDALKPEDAYDVIFVVMQRSQLNSVLPVLYANKYSKSIVLMGNNCNASKVYEEFMKKKMSKARLLFGFLNCGGHHDGAVITNWHTDSCHVIVGCVDGDMKFVESFTKLFSATHLELEAKDDMNAWLKFHSALVTPIALAIQYEGKELKNLRKSEALRLAIEAIKEGIAMFESKGFKNEPPHNMKLLKWSTKKLRFGMALFLPTKTGHLFAVDHSLVAIDEMELLAKSLLEYSNEFGYPMPSLRKLYDMRSKALGNG